MPVINSLALTSYNFSINNGSASTAGPELVFNKARSLTGGPVVSGDSLGAIYFGGADSASTLSVKLALQATSTGTIGPDRIPFGLSFFTAQDAALAPIVNRMAIQSNGIVSVFKADDDTQAIGSPAPTFGVIGTSVVAVNDQVNTDGAFTTLLKSRANGAIVSGDGIGAYGFRARASGGEVVSALINVVSTGTLGAAKVPSDMFFQVSDDATGALNTRLSILEDGLVAVDQQLSVGGDLGAGTASAVDFTNVTATSAGGGAVTFQANGAGAVAQAGWLKIYVNGTVAYLPYFTSI